MSKKAGADRGLAILLDSTYLLPVFGVGVKEVSEEVLLRLRSLALRRLVEVYYSPISLVEVISKVARETIRRGGRGLEPGEVEATIRIIEGSEYLKPAHPNPQAYALAYRMKLLGHNDMIDNLLYATATVHGLTFITIDRKLKNFIQHHKIEGATILSHHELLQHYQPQPPSSTNHHTSTEVFKV